MTRLEIKDKWKNFQDLDNFKTMFNCEKEELFGKPKEYDRIKTTYQNTNSHPLNNFNMKTGEIY